MGLFVANLGEEKKNKKMEMSNNNHQASCSTKTERKIIEKNRRNQMKSLYSKLNSLIPNLNSKDTMPLPDRLDDAASYIKSLQENLEKAKEKKESLQMLARKRRLNTYNITTTNNNDNINGLKSPKIDIRVIAGSTLEIVFTSGTVHNNQLIFYDIIRMLHEEMAEITNASFSVNANSIFLVVHAEIGEPESSLGATRISEKLNKLVHGSCTEVDDDLQPELWDLEIYSEILLDS